jgi:hypothetical protein
MTLLPCQHEAEIKQLLERGHWPQACTQELRTHINSCRACGDLVLVTQAFHSARVASASAASLPPPGVLWWRAQLRRRNAAVERINRPILGAQIFAFAITLLIAVGCVISQAQYSLHWLLSVAGGLGNWLAFVPQSQTFHLEVLWPFASSGSSGLIESIKSIKPNLMYLIPGLGMLAFLSGIVLYLVSEKQ